jgi:hypothetical protein
MRSKPSRSDQISSLRQGQHAFNRLGAALTTILKRFGQHPCVRLLLFLLLVTPFKTSNGTSLRLGFDSKLLD